MNPLKRAIAICGSQKALAERLGHPATQSHVSYWLSHGVPRKWAPKFGPATDFVVTEQDLRPDIFGTRIDSDAA
jgi:DNA-binding transcriptional regulator YdaS (Cro superfamily)